MTTTVTSSFQLQEAPVPAEAAVTLSSKSDSSHVDSEQMIPRHHKPACTAPAGSNEPYARIVFHNESTYVPKNREVHTRVSVGAHATRLL